MEICHFSQGGPLVRQDPLEEGEEVIFTPGLIQLPHDFPLSPGFEVYYDNIPRLAKFTLNGNRFDLFC